MKKEIVYIVGMDEVIEMLQRKYNTNVHSWDMIEGELHLNIIESLKKVN